MAQGLPRPHITWFKDGIELYAHKFFQASNVTVLSTVIHFLALQYICYAHGMYLHQCPPVLPTEILEISLANYNNA